jgi:hypothetical protein
MAGATVFRIRLLLLAAAMALMGLGTEKQQSDLAQGAKPHVKAVKSANPPPRKSRLVAEEVVKIR